MRLVLITGCCLHTRILPANIDFRSAGFPVNGEFFLYFSLSIWQFFHNFVLVLVDRSLSGPVFAVHAMIFVGTKNGSSNTHRNECFPHFVLFANAILTVVDGRLFCAQFTQRLFLLRLHTAFGSKFFSISIQHTSLRMGLAMWDVNYSRTTDSCIMLDYPCSIWPQCADCRSVYACALLACWQCGQRMLPMHNAMRSSEIVAHVGNAPPSVWLAVFFHHCLWIVCEEAQTQKQIDR